MPPDFSLIGKSTAGPTEGLPARGCRPAAGVARPAAGPDGSESAPESPRPAPSDPAAMGPGGAGGAAVPVRWASMGLA